MEYITGPVLGIETSCDETSIAIMDGRRILSNVVSSQAELHRKWGGVVPEVAARKHTEAIIPALDTALREAGAALEDVRAIGVANRPGLIGALAVGVASAKALSVSLRVPLLGVHHLEAHVLSPLLVSEVSYPHVCLLVSGGHTELIHVSGPGLYRRLGGTLDDAAGEVFDKAARTIGLDYPGGPAIQEAAKRGDPRRYRLPRGLRDPTMDFSFSGLKTAVVYLAKREGEALDVPSAAASFEETITSVLAERALYACRETDARAVTLVGGVAANETLRNKMKAMAEERGIRLSVPPPALCTDNAAMIAHVAGWRIARGESDTMDLDAFATAPLPQGGEA